MFAPIERWRENRRPRKEKATFGKDAGFYEIMGINPPDPFTAPDYGKLIDVNLLELVPKVNLRSSDTPSIDKAWQIYVTLYDEQTYSNVYRDVPHVHFYTLLELVQAGMRVIVERRGDKTRVFVESPGDTKVWTQHLKLLAKNAEHRRRDILRAKRQGQAKVDKLRQKYHAAMREQLIAERKAIEYKEQIDHAKELLKG